MLTGYNTDFKFQGKVYHVQTEDGGRNSPQITSLLYSKGEILASRRTSYADIVKADCLDEVVRELMMEQHKQMIRDLMHGKLELNTAPAASAPPPEPVQTEPQAPPVQEAPPATPSPPPVSQEPQEEVKEKSLDDIILDFLAQEQKERNQN